MEDTPEARQKYLNSPTTQIYQYWLLAQPDQWMPTEDQHNVLAVLAHAPYLLNQEAIASETYLNVQTVRKILTVLAKEGFVREPQGKRKGFCLTSAGQDLVRKS